MKHIFLIFALLTGILGQTNNITKVVTLSIYYTSSSTSSKSFISEQLVPTYKILNKYIKLDFVPSGNETVEINRDGNPSFECLWGLFDCLGNQVQACVLQKLEPDALKLQFVDCFMQLYGNYGSISSCTKEVELDMGEIYTCLENSGSEILSNYIARTKKELPDLKDSKYMPHLKIDGITVSDAANGRDIFKIICSLLENVPECKNGAHLITKRQTKPKPSFDGIKTFDITENDKARLLNILKTKNENVRTYNINADNDKHLKETLTKIISGDTNSNKKHKREATVETLSNDTFKIVGDDINELTDALRKFLALKNSKDEEFEIIMKEEEDFPAQNNEIMSRSSNETPKFYRNDLSKSNDTFPELRKIFGLRNNNKEENSTKFETGRSPQKDEYQDYIVQLPPQIRSIMVDSGKSPQKNEYQDYVVQLPPQLRSMMADKKEPSAKYYSEGYKQFAKAEAPIKYFMSPEYAETKENINESKEDNMSKMSDGDKKVHRKCKNKSKLNNNNGDDKTNNDHNSNENYTNDETVTSRYIINFHNYFDPEIGDGKANNNQYNNENYTNNENANSLNHLNLNILNDTVYDYKDFDPQNVTDSDILIKNETAENETSGKNEDETTPMDGTIG